jgi:chromosome segregation ATPase
MSTDKNTASDNSLMEKVKAARVLARNFLRLRRLNDLAAELNLAEKRLSDDKSILKRREASLAGAKYDLEKLDEQHPEFEYKKEALEKMMKNWEGEVTFMSKEVEYNQKQVDEVKTKMDDVQSGKWLCSLDELNAKAEELLGQV